MNKSSLDWIGESIAESVQDSLASEGVLVLNRDERLEGFRRLSLRPGAQLTHASIIKLGMVLDAAKVIYGSFEAAPAVPGSAPGGGSAAKASLRITARVFNLSTPAWGPNSAKAARWKIWLPWKSISDGKASPKLLPSRRLPKPISVRPARRCASTPWKTTSAACWRPIRINASIFSCRPPVWTNIFPSPASN